MTHSQDTQLLNAAYHCCRCSLSRLTPKLLTATRKSFAFDAQTVSDRCDPLVLWYSEIDSIEQFRTQKSVDFTRLIETNIRVGIGSFNDQRDVALSTIDLATKETGLAPKSNWLIALSKWDDALVATRRETEEGEQDLFSIVTNQVSGGVLWNFTSFKPHFLHLA